MQEIELYGLELKGQNPAYVDYSIHGVGEEGGHFGASWSW